MSLQSFLLLLGCALAVVGFGRGLFVEKQDEDHEAEATDADEDIRHIEGGEVHPEIELDHIHHFSTAEQAVDGIAQSTAQNEGHEQKLGLLAQPLLPNKEGDN